MVLLGEAGAEDAQRWDVGGGGVGPQAFPALPVRTPVGKMRVAPPTQSASRAHLCKPTGPRLLTIAV